MGSGRHGQPRSITVIELCPKVGWKTGQTQRVEPNIIIAKKKNSPIDGATSVKYGLKEKIWDGVMVGSKLAPVHHTSDELITCAMEVELSYLI